MFGKTHKGKQLGIENLVVWEQDNTNDFQQDIVDIISYSDNNSQDTIYVDNNSDNIIHSGEGSNNTIYVHDNSDNTIHSGEGIDISDSFVIFNDNNNNFKGNNGNDTVFGNGGDDVLDGKCGIDNLHGGDGNDKLKGGAGDDYLFGDAGDDKLKGGNGNDVLSGGLGKDKLNGGAGDDIFNFSSLLDSNSQSMDKISDFTQGEDLIDLSGTGLSFDDIEIKVNQGDIIVSDTNSDFAFEIDGDFGTLTEADFIFS